MTTTEEEARRYWHDECFGDRYWRYPGPNGKTHEEMMVDSCFGNRAMVAMSLLSDAQELIAMCANAERGMLTNQRLERSRQLINKAKSILGDFSTEFHVQQLKDAGISCAIDGTLLEEVQ